MNITNDAPSMDYIQYFTKQLPQDLAKMAALRDELAKRQGAISAVEAALADREKAKDELATARAQIEILVAETKAAHDSAKKIKQTADARDKEVAKREAEFEKSMKAREDSVAAVETAVGTREIAVDSRERHLAEAQAKLEADRAALDQRIKLFQDRVASF